MALWGLLFASPVLSFYVRTMGDEQATFEWSMVFMVWQRFMVFLLLFIIHNYLIAPLLVYEHKRMLYGSLVTMMVGAFLIFQCSNKPKGEEAFPKEPKEHFERFDEMGPPPFEEGSHFRPDDNGRPGGEHRPPAIVGEHDIIAVVILLLMLLANVGIKFYFKNREDQKRLVALEHENLEQQLEYLKYQINPHFFMNTLNNIHALVDIDAEKAKSTILELSKMMRFILYEGDKKGVPLGRELDFIRNYITLMRLRYTDKVKINVELPTQVPDRMLPPLMLITFIENAFKHGISYLHESFIDVKVTIDSNQLQFTCRNSKAEKPNQEKGGVGLKNVKQRLNLLYDNNYTLTIQDNPDVYHVELIIPLTQL